MAVGRPALLPPLPPAVSGPWKFTVAKTGVMPASSCVPIRCVMPAGLLKTVQTSSAIEPAPAKAMPRPEVQFSRTAKAEAKASDAAQIEPMPKRTPAQPDLRLMTGLSWAVVRGGLKPRCF